MDFSKMPPGMSEERMKAIYDSFVTNQDEGRSLKELKESTDKLKGAEGQRLRSAFTSYGLHPGDCKNFHLVAALMTANFPKMVELWEEDVEKSGGGETGKKEAAKKWFEYRDSPNKLPIYDILLVGALTQMDRLKKIPEQYYEVQKWMIGLGIAVEGTDVAGYTALQHSLGLTPLLVDYRWSQMLLDASADAKVALNHRNRFGGTLMHGVMACYMRPGEEKLRAEVLRWCLDRGGNPDIPDNDTCAPRSMIRHAPLLRSVLAEYDKRKIDEHACAFCGMGGVEIVGKGKGAEEKSVPKKAGEPQATLRCGKCRKTNYCSANCQRMDWGHHKSKVCKP